jgi:hypothetical protein
MTAPVAHAADAAGAADVLFDEAFLRRLEQLELASRRMTAGRMKGERRSVRRGQSVEFADYRNYSAGDDLRQLDWNVYARLERLFIKLFVEEEDVTVHVLVDASRSMDFGEPNKLTFARRGRLPTWGWPTSTGSASRSWARVTPSASAHCVARRESSRSSSSSPSRAPSGSPGWRRRPASTPAGSAAAAR